MICELAAAIFEDDEPIWRRDDCLFTHTHARAHEHSSQSVPTHARMGIRIKQIARRRLVLSRFRGREFLLLCTRAVFDNNIGLIVSEEESAGFPPPPGGQTVAVPTHIYVYVSCVCVCTRIRRRGNRIRTVWTYSGVYYFFLIKPINEIRFSDFNYSPVYQREY